jgi:hypothetical protein
MHLARYPGKHSFILLFSPFRGMVYFTNLPPRGRRAALGPVTARAEMAATRKQALNPSTVAPPLKGYYSNCVRVNAGPLLLIAGQITTDVEGRTTMRV